MATFYDMINIFEKLGLSDIILPFILIFTITFAIMQSINLLGDNKKIHSVLAFVFGMAVVIPHVTNTYPAKYDIVNIINQALPNVSLILVAVVSLIIILGIFGFSLNIKQQSVFGMTMLVVVFGLITYIFGSAAGWGWRIPNWLGFLNDPDTQALLLIILVFGIVIWFITKPEKTDADKGKFMEHARDNWQAFIKGGTE